MESREGDEGGEGRMLFVLVLRLVIPWLIRY